MKIEEKLNKIETEGEEKNDKNIEENNNKDKSSDVRLDEKDKENSGKDKIGIEKNQNGKNTDKKRVYVDMYTVLFAFLFIPMACAILHHTLLDLKIKELFNNKEFFYFIFFIVSLSLSFLISLGISYYEFLIKKHCLGITFFIILNLLIDYSVIYISYLSFFEQILSFLIVLESGSFGCIFISLIVKDNTPSSLKLAIFNFLFASIGGISMYFAYERTGPRTFTILGLILSEVNVFSSQYKLFSEERKEPLTYSLPFELIISIFKMLYFVISNIVKLIKLCYRFFKFENKGQKGGSETGKDIILTEDNKA